MIGKNCVVKLAPHHYRSTGYVIDLPFLVVRSAAAATSVRILADFRVVVIVS